uniref:NADH dehydrogenase n=1 Tax=Ignisphaera aggregans TaxID=334771 RepID=A0A7C5TES7_9CREN
MDMLYYITIILALIIIISSRIKNSIIRGLGYIMLIIIPLYSIIVGSPWDFTSSSLAILAAIIGFSASMYTNGYEDLKYGGGYLHIIIDIFAVAVYLTFTALNVITFIVCWLIAEIIGFFTIVYEIERKTLTAGLRYIAVSMIPSDMALMTLLASLSMKKPVTDALLTPINDITNALGELPPIISIIIVLGFIAKAAVIPLHFWLPDAHSLAPAPASSILSGIMVKMGIYGIIRLLPSIDPIYTPYIFIFFGALTGIYGGFLALTQMDIKRILAYSTIEHTGLIILALMLYRVSGLALFFTAALTIIYSHALYKAALFLNSGSIEIYSHTREISKLGYLARTIPSAAFSALLSILSLIGIPPTMGFIAKLNLLMSIITYLVLSPAIGAILIALVAIAIALAAIYSLRYATVYWGTWRGGGAEKSADIVVELSRKVTIWEYIPAGLGIIGTPLIATIIWGLDILKPELLAPLILAIALFIPLLYYIYIRLKTASRDMQWLGGAVP